jgi:hypothetical protein
MRTALASIQGRICSCRGSGAIKMVRPVWVTQNLGYDNSNNNNINNNNNYYYYYVAVGLERGPLSLVRINEDLLERKIIGSALENWD